MESLSIRGRRALSPALSYFDKQLAGVAAGLYDQEKQPEGYILLAVAENRLPRSYRALETKLQQCRTIEPSSTAYTNMCGRQILREAFAKTIMRTVLHQSSLLSSSTSLNSTTDSTMNSNTIMDGSTSTSSTTNNQQITTTDESSFVSSSGSSSSILSTTGSNLSSTDPTNTMDTSDTILNSHPNTPVITINPDHLVISSGVGAVINNLAFTLLEPNDGVLLPTPTYGALYNDFAVLAQTRIIDIPLDNSKDNYRLSKEALENAYQTAVEQNITVKMLFIINPNNPLGIVYTEQEITVCIEFCQKYKLHLVCDEIYANSVYQPVVGGEGRSTGSSSSSFKSIVQIMAEKTLASSSVSTVSSSSPSSTHVPLRNTAPEFVGYKQLKMYLKKQVRQFEQWAENEEWGEIHHSHYDWWTFPIPDKSSYGYKFAVFEADIIELQKDSEYVHLLERAAELVCLGWGWNLREGKPVPENERSDGQEWSNWPVRLFKIALSLDLFGSDQLCASARLFGQTLMNEGEQFTYSGHDLTWQFTSPYERPPRNDNVPHLFIPKRTKSVNAILPNNFLGNYIHVLWGFSKDFAMSGFRVGCLYTHNEALLSAMGNINYFTTVSNDTQDTLARMLQDSAWIDHFFQINKEELAKSAIAVRNILDNSNIPYVHASAGMFIWIDLRKYLPPDRSSLPGNTTITGASLTVTNPFDREKQLVEELYKETRLLFTPGEACHAREPGFFRCCFAWMPLDAVTVGFERLKQWISKKQSISME